MFCFFYLIFFFNIFKIAILKALLNYKKNISLKFEIASSKNKKKDKFLGIF